jgi:hypothetical protein
VFGDLSWRPCISIWLISVFNLIKVLTGIPGTKRVSMILSRVWVAIARDWIGDSIY